MGVLETVYMVCLVLGLIYTVISLLFGDTLSDWLGHLHLPFAQPILLVSGMTAFGGAGYLLSRYTSLGALVVLMLAAVIGIALALVSYFLWVKPMSHAENSTSYSMSQLGGKLGEVGTTIPAEGLGEVLLPMISGTTYHMAASLEGGIIPQGTRVVVVEVRDHVLYVIPFYTESGEGDEK
ncbi:NfeD family protein [Brevibacillus sp. DP1.3A]|uniref:NfeD family protein n=1 Tax=unclassified Brevibacillus TaxID=2684853 RepID=UPI00156B0BA9|nr:NfeD family protein [Brevibacillus sp. DP1.3A]MED1914006.1 NfeD family protein [Bacillus thuringiensis]UED76126.1 serine protease [Brevibacillus sp. DP1.3A]